MAQWWIKPQPDGMVCIDDAVLSGVDCSLVAANIYLVFWYGTNGEILYNHDDRMPVREPFTDMSPYIPVFDKWMSASQEYQPPISLAQAKTVKNSMVDALFASKRQLPVSMYGYTWDGSDNATGAMTDQIAAVSGTDAINSAVGALASSTNAAIQNLAISSDNAVQFLSASTNSALNTAESARASDAASLNAGLGSQATGHNLNVNVANANFNSLSGYSATIGTDGGTVTLPGLSYQDGVPTPTLPASPGSRTTAPGISAPTVAATPASGPDITWPPLNGPPVTLTYPQFTALLGVMTSRRASLQLTRTSHKNNITTMTTVDGIVSYDITQGW